MRRKLFVALGILVLLSGIISIMIKNSKNGELVSVSPVVKSDIHCHITATGTIAFATEYTISPRTGGKIASILVNDGTHVKAGQVLIQLDKREYDVQEIQASGQIITATNQLKKIKQGPRSQELAQGQGSLRSAEATYQQAILTLERIAKLYTMGGVSKEQLDNAELGAKTAKESFVIQQQNVSLMEEGATHEDIGIQIGQLQQAQAAFARVSDLLTWTTVVSPIDGTVFGKNAVEGDMVDAEAVLFKVGNLKYLVVNAEVEEQYLWALKNGDTVGVTGKAFRGIEYSGTVDSISPTPIYSPVKSKNAKYNVKVLIDNTDEHIKPGMNAEIHFKANGVGGLLIPREALIKNTSSPQVFIVINGYAKLVEITTGMESDWQIEALSGLVEGQNIILKPPADLKDGVAVHF